MGRLIVGVMLVAWVLAALFAWALCRAAAQPPPRDRE